MTADQLKSIIKKIMFSNKPFGLQVYACVKNDCGLTLKSVQSTDSLLHSISELIESTVKTNLLADELEIDSADKIADNKKVLYEIEQSSLYAPFAFLESYGSTIDLYSELDQDALTGFAFMVNRNDSAIWFYQHVYAVHMLKRSRALYAILNSGSTYTLLNRDVVRIDARIDATIVGKSIITSKIDLLQKSFGFTDYVRREAQSTISQIKQMGLLADSTKLEELIGKESLTNAKKLMRVKNSPVLKMDKAVLFRKMANHPRYKDKFKIENDTIIIRTQKDAGELVKMLNDDIVRSELTDQEYDSPSKQILEPLSA